MNNNRRAIPNVLLPMFIFMFAMLVDMDAAHDAVFSAAADVELVFPESIGAPADIACWGGCRDRAIIIVCGERAVCRAVRAGDGFIGAHCAYLKG